MKEQFCDYETSKMLKELGFDEPCFGVYSVSGEFNYPHEVHQLYRPKNTQLGLYPTAPLFQQVKQWIYETHQAYIQLDFDKDGYYIASLVSEDGNWNFVLDNSKIHDYVEAENHAIQKSVEWLHENIEK